MPFSDWRATTRTSSPAPVGRLISNPVEMVQWAVATGRIDAVDGPLWLGLLQSGASIAYSDMLLERPGHRYKVIHTKVPSSRP